MEDFEMIVKLFIIVKSNNVVQKIILKFSVLFVVLIIFRRQT